MFCVPRQVELAAAYDLLPPVPSQNPIGVPAPADGGEHAGTIALNHGCREARDRRGVARLRTPRPSTRSATATVATVTSSAVASRALASRKSSPHRNHPCPWARTRRSREPSTRRAWGRSWSCPKSAASTTATNAWLPERRRRSRGASMAEIRPGSLRYVVICWSVAVQAAHAPNGRPLFSAQPAPPSRHCPQMGFGEPHPVVRIERGNRRAD